MGSRVARAVELLRLHGSHLRQSSPRRLARSHARHASRRRSRFGPLLSTVGAAQCASATRGAVGGACLQLECIKSGACRTANVGADELRFTTSLTRLSADAQLELAGLKIQGAELVGGRLSAVRPSAPTFAAAPSIYVAWLPTVSEADALNCNHLQFAFHRTRHRRRSPPPRASKCRFLSPTIATSFWRTFASRVASTSKAHGHWRASPCSRGSTRRRERLLLLVCLFLHHTSAARSETSESKLFEGISGVEALQSAGGDEAEATAKVVVVEAA